MATVNPVKKLILFLLLNLGATYAQDVDESLRYFLAEKMNGFGAWIAGEKLDPTPPWSEGVVNMSLSSGLFHLTGTLSNVSVVGMSSNVTDFYAHQTSFMGKHIGIEFVLSYGAVRGNYNASGVVLGAYPISGNGNWSIVSDRFSVSFFEVFYLDNGYITLNDSSPWGYYYEEFNFGGNPYGNFQDLFTPPTSPYEGEIIREIASKLPFNVFGNGNGGTPVFLMYRHVLNYLKTVFQSYPASEIINWPAPTTTPHPESQAPSTTTNRISTTSFPETTNIPCGNAYKVNNEDEILNEGLKNFLSMALRGYGEWLISNRLDPTPPIISPAVMNINTTFLNLQGVYGNSVGAGMSNLLYVYYINADLVVPQLHLNFMLYNLTLSGNYLANGTIISLYPISGEGAWELGRFDLEIDMHISGFGIDDGFININKFDYRAINLSPHTEYATVSMPDLVTPDSADGLGQAVLEVLGEAIPVMLHQQDKHPITKSVLDYLSFLFARTPLTEIIGTTRPPWPC